MGLLQKRKKRSLIKARIDGGGIGPTPHRLFEMLEKGYYMPLRPLKLLVEKNIMINM